MTVTCTGDPSILEQMIKQLAKLVDVVHAIDHTGTNSYETEIALIKVAAPPDDRRSVLDVAEHFSAKVVDFASESLVLRVYGSSEKLDAFIALLVPYNVIELVRSGKVLMARGLETT